MDRTGTDHTRTWMIALTAMAVALTLTSFVAA